MTTFKFKLTTQVQLEILEAEARTFGELKQAIKNSPLGEKISFERQKEIREGIEWIKTIKLIEKNTLAEYGNLDDAALPAGDTLIFFVTPIEHKSGLYPDDLDRLTKDELLDQLEEMGYNELRSFGSQLNRSKDADIDLSGRRDNILINIMDWVEEYYEEDDNNTEVQNSEIKDLLESAVSIIIDAIEALQNLELTYATEELVDGTMTASQLHERALDIQKRLNS